MGNERDITYQRSREETAAPGQQSRVHEDSGSREPLPHAVAAGSSVRELSHSAGKSTYQVLRKIFRSVHIRSLAALGEHVDGEGAEEWDEKLVNSANPHVRCLEGDCQDPLSREDLPGRRAVVVRCRTRRGSRNPYVTAQI